MFNNACFMVVEQDKPTDDNMAEVWRTAAILADMIHSKVGDTLVYICQEPAVGGHCDYPFVNGVCYRKHRLQDAR